MKILITVAWGERLGGAENLLWSFLKHVNRQRIVPTVVFFEAGPFEREVSSIGIETSVVPVGRLRNVRSFVAGVREVGRLVRSVRPDLLMNWSAKTQLYGSLAGCLAGMPRRIIWWQHGLARGHWLDRAATVLPARAIVCCSESARLTQDSQWPHRSTVVVYPGIDRPVSLSTPARKALRDHLSIPAGSLVLGIVGRLQPWKGQHRFIRAVAELIHRGHCVHGLVVGGDAYGLSPDYEVYLRRLANEIGIKKHLTFTGQVSDATPFIQLMDISVNASVGEPFGLTLLESMALGVPVVAFAAGGPVEILDSGRAGVLVPGQDERCLADGLESLVVDSHLRRRIGQSGYERFIALFTSDRMTWQLEQCLSDICPN